MCPMADTVRLDKWLWVARFYKTRSLAKAAIESGKVRSEGERLKPAQVVKPGQRYTILRDGLSWTITIRGIAEQRGSGAMAALLYEEDETSIAERARIVALPGVPAELKAIVEGPLQSLLKELFGRGSYREREVVVECGDESRLAPALREVVAAHPEVYIKSRASHFGRDVTFRITLSATAESAEAADRLILAASDDLARTFAEAGIRITDNKA